MKNKQDLEVHVGTLLKNLPEQHDIEFKVGFNLHSNTFFQKLVSKELIEKGVRIHTDDFYKGLVFLDYFCGVIENDYRVCDNLVKISKALRKAEKEKGEDKNASYLKLGVVVEEATLCAKENSDDYSDKSTIDAIKQRYENKENIDFNSESLRKADPYYEALGLMVLDLVSEERKELLGDVTSRTELGAVVFTDCILDVLEDSEYKTKADEALSKKDYLGASITALDGLRKEASISKLKSLIAGNKND